MISAFVIFDVIVKKIQRIGVSYDLDIPYKENDTTVGAKGRVYVKYDDYHFYPKFIVYYKS